jgi:hypothetical protein
VYVAGSFMGLMLTASDKNNGSTLSDAAVRCHVTLVLLPAAMLWLHCINRLQLLPEHAVPSNCLLLVDNGKLLAKLQCKLTIPCDLLVCCLQVVAQANTFTLAGGAQRQTINLLACLLLACSLYLHAARSGAGCASHQHLYARTHSKSRTVRRHCLLCTALSE